MKVSKKVSMLLIISMSTILFGCNYYEANVNEVNSGEEVPHENVETSHVKSNARIKTSKIDSRTYLLTDSQSGIQYLQVNRNSGAGGGVDIAVLLDDLGHPYVADGNEEIEGRFTYEKLDSMTSILTDNITNVEYLVVFRNSGAGGGIAVMPLLK